MSRILLRRSGERWTKKTISLSFTWLGSRTKKKKQTKLIYRNNHLQSLQLFRPCIYLLGICACIAPPVWLLCIRRLIWRWVRMAWWVLFNNHKYMYILFFFVLFVGRIYISAPLHWIINKGGHKPMSIWSCILIQI